MIEPTKNLIECKGCKNVYRYRSEDEVVIPKAEFSKKLNHNVSVLAVFCPLCRTPYKIKTLEV